MTEKIKWQKTSGDKPLREYKAEYGGKTWLLCSNRTLGQNTPADWTLTNTVGARFQISQGVMPTEKAKELAETCILGRRK